MKPTSLQLFAFELLLLLGLFTAGCSKPAEQKPAPMNESAGTQAEPRPKSSASGSEFTHHIGSETFYYLDGPQQARPPDGMLSVGTKVSILEESGSYSRVRTAEGVEAHVAADSIEPAE